jgi:serine/threonine protein kinase
LNDLSGGRLGKYEILQRLGAGAMGVVYLAYDPAIGRRVAVKTIRKDLLDEATAATVSARFRNEAMAAGRLTHPGIVAIYDYGESDETAYIVMEYAPGEDLQRYASARRITLFEIRMLMTQLLDALEHAHQAGIVHRDIKPTNLLVADRLKVTDFGIARIASSQLTRTGAVIGTPAYMAPEQYRGAGVDHRADLFASGVILYELLTGHTPFRAESLEEMAYKVCHTAHVPATQIRPDLPRAVDGLLARALAKNSHERFASAREFARDIEAAFRAPGVAAELAFDPTAFAGTPSSSGNESGALSRSSVPSLRAATNVAPEAIDRITTTLAKYVGPIATVMVKKAAADAVTYRDLCVAVSARLSAEEKPAFLRELGVE